MVELINWCGLIIFFFPFYVYKKHSFNSNNSLKLLKILITYFYVNHIILKFLFKKLEGEKKEKGKSPYFTIVIEQYSP